MTNLPLLADVAADAQHCSFCPKMCRFACPVAESTGKESVTPWGIDRVVAALARGETLTTQEQAPIWACTGCRQCAGPCLPGVDLPSNVRAARAAVTERPAGVEAAAGIPFAPDGALRAGATTGAATIVYPGCRAEDQPALARLLAAAGMAYDVVDEITCCGARDADLGDAEAARERSRDLVARLAGATRVVVTDPHCADGCSPTPAWTASRP
jgi:Fe-S oxidoreductase